MNYSLANKKPGPPTPKSGQLSPKQTTAASPRRLIAPMLQAKMGPSTPKNGGVQLSPKIKPVPEKTPSVPQLDVVKMAQSMNKNVNSYKNESAKTDSARIDTAKTAAEKPAYVKKVHTTESIISDLAGYFKIPRDLWDHMPIGAHIRYFKKLEGTRVEKYRVGGYIRHRYTNAEGKKCFMLESRQNGKSSDPGYVSFPVCYDDLEELWKQYEKNTFVEIHLMMLILAEKDRKIIDLENRLKKLEKKT